MDFNSFDSNLRELVLNEQSPLSLTLGRIWSVDKKSNSISVVNQKIFDKHLKIFQELSLEVLGEVNPTLALAKEDRFSARVYGKENKYSDALRTGLSETLAWLGTNRQLFKNCSPQFCETTVLITIRKLLTNKDWQLWASINNLLPAIAEADPNEFLSCVESALHQNPCPFDEIFAQESNDFGSTNYMTGLLWALEGLAWFEDHIASVNIILAELATRDPGGNWGNRPINSLKTILLPWFPQTLASVEKRLASVKAIKRDFPTIAWKLISSLLPNQNQTSSGTHKPEWRFNLPSDWNPSVTEEQYWEEVSIYAEYAVEMATSDLDILKFLVKELDHLPQSSFDAVLDYLASEKMINLPEVERNPIWISLTSFVQRHRRFSNSEWAFDDDKLSKIESIAGKLSPHNPEVIYQMLFGNNEFDLFDDIESGNYDEQRKKLELRRQNAIKEIFEAVGFAGLVRFAGNVGSPYAVGWSLAKITNHEITSQVLPDQLASETEASKQLARGFISNAHFNYGWEWVDALNRSKWSPELITELLICLPFEDQAWQRAKEWLSDKEELYWKESYVNPYQTNGDLLYAVDKLLEVNRPYAALSVLHSRVYKNGELDCKRTVKALLSANNSCEPLNQMSSYHVTELIKALQNNPNTEPEDLYKVEWFCMPLLNDLHGLVPKLLQEKLSTEPEFFCEMINLIYKPKSADPSELEPDEQTAALATNAWRLLDVWKRPPGLLEDGVFDADIFLEWLERVKGLSTKSDRFEVAMIKVGEVLYYCPPIPNGLWIPKLVAEKLDAIDGEYLRSGFRTEIFNSRGAHWVDPQAKPERELASKWRSKAELVENEGFPRFANTLKEVANSYDRDAERIIAEHTQSNVEEQVSDNTSNEL